MAESSSTLNPLTESLLPQGNDDEKRQYVASTAEPEPEQQTLTTPFEDTEDPSSPPIESWERGETQPSRFRDLPYAVLFHAQFFAVTILAVTNGLPDVKEYLRKHEPEARDLDLFDGFNDEGEEPLPLYPSLLVAFLSASVFVVLTLMVVIHNSEFFIKCSILFNAVFTLFLGLLNLALGLLFPALILFFFGAIGCWYYCAVRNRIPFAAANLRAGSSAVKDHAGVVLLAYFWSVLFSLWTLLWGACVYYTVKSGAVEECLQDDTLDEACEEVSTVDPKTKLYLVLLVLSFYWTQQVFGNVLHTTVAGVVGSWYFSGEGVNGCFCGTVVWTSALRTLTYSFGSVCCGSLLVALVSTLRFLVNMRDDRSTSAVGSVLFCILDCILAIFEAALEYFNKWAFVYVGLYGYPYVTAGKKVTTLFQQRGWSVIINDQLVARALNFTSLTVALLCGTVQYLFFHDVWFFAFGFAFGLFFSYTTMSVLDSAVSTIVVCFAEAPEELEISHEDHSRAMKDAWYGVYQVRC